jgi:dihydropyrimidine dehydrogenase (NAD+) subunit PreA
VQVCTAAMHHGFKIVEDMCEGLSNWMDDKGYKTLEDFRGLATKNYKNWNELNMNFDTKALINQDKCINCGLCHIACEDTSHQAISISKQGNKNVYTVVDQDCVGCNLCQHVCPVDDCITMNPVDNGKPYMNWQNDPRNPAAKKKTA